MEVAAIRHRPVGHQRGAEPVGAADDVFLRPAVERQRRSVGAHAVDEATPLQCAEEGDQFRPFQTAGKTQTALQGGQGVFGIAIAGAFKEIQGTLSDLPAEPAAEAPSEESTDDDAVGDDAVGDELAARRARRRAG